MAATSHELFAQLKKLIDLPDDCVAVTIHLHVDQAATVTVRRHVRLLGGIGEVESRYLLTEIKDADATQGASASVCKRQTQDS